MRFRIEHTGAGGGPPNSRSALLDGKNGKTAVASGTTKTLERARVAHRSEEALFIGGRTRSALDLEKVGASVYLEHWSTEVWVACYAIGDGPVQVWRRDCPVPPDLAAHVRAGGPVVAQEVALERGVWSKVMAPRHGWPVPRLEQWHCIAALSAAMALPRKLDEAARVLGLSSEQGLLDNNLMRQLGTPRNIGEIPLRIVRRQGPTARTLKLSLQQRPEVSDGARLARRPRNYRARHWSLHPRCEMAREPHARLQSLPALERQIWLLDQRINERGISIDLDLARMEHRMVEDRLKWLNAQLSDITDGAVSSATQIAKLLAWLRSNGVMPPRRRREQEAR